MVAKAAETVTVPDAVSVPQNDLLPGDCDVYSELSRLALSRGADECSDALRARVADYKARLQ